MTTITLILLAAAVAAGFSLWWRLPTIPLMIVSGLLISQVMGEAGLDQLPNVMVLGLTFLLFFAGTELDIRRVGKQWRAAIWIGLAQFLFLALAGAAAGILLGWDRIASIYLGLAVAASSTLVVVRLLRQRQQFFEPFGRLVLGILLLQDVLIIVAIACLGSLDEGGLAILASLGGAAFLLIMAMVFARWINPWLLLRRSVDGEMQLLLIIALLFGFMGASWQMGLPPAVGAFLAGVALSTFPVSGVIRGQLNSLSDFFLAIFFVSLGATLDLPNFEQILVTVSLVALLLLITPPLVALLAMRMGFSTRLSVLSGLMLAQCSEFSLIVALIGLQVGHIDATLFKVVAMLTVASMILTPFIATETMARRILGVLTPRRRQVPQENLSDHFLLLGCGQSGMGLLRLLQRQSPKLVVIEDDQTLVAQIRSQRQIPVILDDAADAEVLAAAGAERARAIISTLPPNVDLTAILAYATKVPVFVRVFTPEQARLVESHGGHAVVYAHEAAQETMNWFAERFAQTRGAGPDVRPTHDGSVGDAPEDISHADAETQR